MHPNPASLQAYHDGELEPARNRRVDRHLQRCQACRLELARMEQNMALFSRLADASTPAALGSQGAAEVWKAFEAWSGARATDRAARADLRVRVRSCMEIYFGAQAGAMIDNGAPGAMGVAESLLETFLGRSAGMAITERMVAETRSPRWVVEAS